VPTIAAVHTKVTVIIKRKHKIEKHGKYSINLYFCVARDSQSINQSINQHALAIWRPTSKSLGRQKYNENTTA